MAQLARFGRAKGQMGVCSVDKHQKDFGATGEMACIQCPICMRLELRAPFVSGRLCLS